MDAQENVWIVSIAIFRLFSYDYVCSVRRQVLASCHANTVPVDRHQFVAEWENKFLFTDFHHSSRYFRQFLLIN